jgi:DNA-binding CsgD family transcriptional regulator
MRLVPFSDAAPSAIVCRLLGTDIVVGRDAEIAAGERFLDAILDSTHALVLEGEPGIGKTTIWRETARRAGERGYRVVTARPAQAEASLSFAGLGDLLAGVPEAALDRIPVPQRHALEIALLRRAPTGPPREPRAVAVALFSTLVAIDEPLVVAVDDAQWLDRPTAAALAFAARRLEREQIGFLVSVRAQDGRRPSFDSAFAEQRRSVLRIGPLSLAALQAIIKERVGCSFPRPTLVRIEQVSGGNPFYALEIARELADHGDSGVVGSLPIPDDLRRLVLAHIRKLPSATRDALLTISALADPGTDDIDEASLGPALAGDVIRVEPSGRIRFSHPLFASAVYETATPSRRRDLHARLAGRVGDPEERARHLALAASGPDEVVARALDEAARQARARGAIDAAVELEQQALRLTPPARSDAAAHRGVSLGELLFAAGDTSGARAALQAVVERTCAGEVHSTALALLGMVRWFEGAWDEGIRLAEDALQGVDDPAVRAQIHFRISCVCDWDVARGAAHARAALELLDEAREPGLYSAALLSLAEWELKAGRGATEEAVAHALALQQQAEGWQRSHVPAYWARLTDDFATARARHEAWLERGRAEQDDPVVCHELMHLGVLAFLTGDPGRAATLLAEALALAERGGDVIFERSAQAWLAHVEAHLGLVEEARARAEHLLAHVGSYPLSEARPRQTLGFLALSLGDAREADLHFTRADELLGATGMREPADHRFHADHIEAVLALGELERAEALLGRLEERARTLPRPWTLAVASRCRGLLQAGRGEREDAVASLQGALTWHERLDMPFELARTLLCLGQVQRRRNRRRAAREALADALELFERLPAPLWAERTRAEIARIGVRRAPEELTVNEQRVAELAAAGLTNREIAAKLFLSRRTVEANLARAYRKLGIRSRAELGAQMAVRERA